MNRSPPYIKRVYNWKWLSINKIIEKTAADLNTEERELVAQVENNNSCQRKVAGVLF